LVEVFFCLRGEKETWPALENGRRMRIAMATVWPFGLAIAAALTMLCWPFLDGQRIGASRVSRRTPSMARDADADQPSVDNKQRIDDLILNWAAHGLRCGERPRPSWIKSAGSVRSALCGDRQRRSRGCSERSVLVAAVTVHWTRSDDSAKVRQIFRNYGEQDDEEHKRSLVLLSQLPNDEGIAGLCRIARFDRSPLISRLAAVAIIIAGGP